MKKGTLLVSAVLAGMSIGFGGLVFLSVENRVIGAALFTIGLFCVCTFGFHLFTGKVCYVFQNDRAYALDLPLIDLADLEELGKTNPLYAELDRIVKANDGLWCAEAEKVLLAEAKAI